MYILKQICSIGSHDQRAFRLMTLALLLLTFLAPWTEPVFADNTTIVPGKPVRAGNDRITLDKDDGTAVTVTVAIAGTEDKFEKADKIQVALNAAGFDASVTAAGNVNVDGVRNAIFSTVTGEVDKVAFSGTPPSFGELQYAGLLEGIDPIGGEAIYAASFGFGVTQAEALLSFSDLPGASLDILLSSIFDDLLVDLPSSLQPNLHLDLANDFITFDFPEGAEDPFASIGTTDNGLTATVRLSVPEPSTFLLLCLAPVIFIGHRLSELNR